MSSVRYTVVSTPESIDQAAEALSSSSCLIVDCEARDLGCVGGALSLLSIGATSGANGVEVFLFDALAYGLAPGPTMCDGMRTVLDLLESESKLKVVWDGRMDYAELLSTYGVYMRGVLDLQLVEIATRGETETRRLGRINRLRCFSRRYDVFKHRHLFNEMHLLVGLDRCVQNFGLDSIYRKDAVVTRLHHENGSKIWMQRPLNDRLLSYAAGDIYAINAVYEHFTDKGAFRPVRMATLLEQSARYVDIYDGIGRVDPDGLLPSGPFLPLDVLTKPTGDAKICAGCRRAISPRHFATNGGGPGQPSSFCRVCAALKLMREFSK